MTEKLTALSARKLTAALRQCGLTPAWAEAVAGRRPFAAPADVCAAVENVLLHLERDELTRALELQPVPSVERGDPDVLEAAQLAMRLYRDRFGYPFVSAIETRTADELLMRVRIRLGNEPGPESRAAREHLRRIVRSRLQNLIELDASV